MKSQPFSIFLLKEGYNDKNSIINEDDNLKNKFTCKTIPENSILYIDDKEEYSPWWVEYFGVQETIKQQSKSALLFLTVEDRCFVLSFGHAYNKLDDNSYEHDFGLIITLNCLDPEQLKSTDTVDPDALIRKKIQTPINSDLTQFDFDGDSEILSGLTGKVQEQYKELFTHVTGTSNLKVNLKKYPAELGPLCTKLLTIYSSQEYLTTFPEVNKIIPVKDPEIIKNLDKQLVKCLQEKNDQKISLSIPEIVDYSSIDYYRFTMGKSSIKNFNEININEFYNHTKNIDPKEVNINFIKKCKIHIYSESQVKNHCYSVYNSLNYEVIMDNEDNSIYHLCNGKWFKIDKEYVKKMEKYINHHYEEINFPPYESRHDKSSRDKKGKFSYSEENYNKSVANENNMFLCLDQKDITISKQKQIEPCDLLYLDIENKKCILCHIKISCCSSQLSHLFNQGLNSIHLLLLENESQDKLLSYITESNICNKEKTINAIKNKEYKVVYGIITKKNVEQQSLNLSIFSKMSLMRTLKFFQIIRIHAVFTYIEDKSQIKGSYMDLPQVEVVLSKERTRFFLQVTKNQTWPEGTEIIRYSRDMEKEKIGTKFKVYVKKELSKGKKLQTNKNWNYSII